VTGRRFPRGRGSASNPVNRFTGIEVEADEPLERVTTIYLRDASRSIVSTNTSPDARMRGTGELAEQMRSLFHLTCRRVGLATEMPCLSAEAFCRPGGEQLRLFD
jgi:hypothetical protein